DVLEEPISVAQFMGGGGGVAAAEALRAALEAAGIEAFTSGHCMGDTTGWVRVTVAGHDCERAEAVIADMDKSRRRRERLERRMGKSMLRCLACDRPMTEDRCRHCAWSWLDGAEEE